MECALREALGKAAELPLAAGLDAYLKEQLVRSAAVRRRSMELQTEPFRCRPRPRVHEHLVLRFLHARGFVNATVGLS